jgi:hypothetical protein
MEKGDLPVWHKDYIANSTAHVDPFAKNPSNKFSKSSNGFTAKSDYYLNSSIASTFSVGTDKFTGTNENLVYKGCGLLYETTASYSNGWTTDYTTGLQPNKGVSSNSANKCFHIVWEKGTLTMYRTTDNATCPVDSSDYVGGDYIYTFYNVPPLIYFEFVAGGGGGAGGANYCTGGGGGGGAGCCGILNFTSAVARQVGYFL